MLSRDEFDPDAPVEAKVVEEIFQRTAEIWRLTAGGRTIETSGEHPFFARGRGWVNCNELSEGEWLLCEDGTWVEVQEVESTGDWASVYNLRVADHHTYFVGKEEWGFSVWAHNVVCWTDFLGYNKGRTYPPSSQTWMAQTGDDWNNRFKPAYAGTPGSSWTSRSGLIYGLPYSERRMVLSGEKCLGRGYGPESGLARR